MKKLVLVMVFVILTALFVSFNYLLWERESREQELRNLQSANAGHNANISAQKREIDTLVEESRSQREKIEQLQNEIDRLTQERVSLTSEKNNTEASLVEKIGFINAIKQHTDIKVLSEPVQKWADALNQGNYEEAFELEYAGTLMQDRKVSLSEYTEEMKSKLHSVEISEIKLDTYKGSSSGDIILQAALNVRFNEGAIISSQDSIMRFKEGINETYIRIDYSKEEGAFIISSISVK